MIGAGLVHPSVNRTVAEWGDSVFGFTVTSRTLENQDWVFTVTSVATGVIVRKYTGVVNGAVSIRWRADDQLGAAVPPGDYRLELQSYAGRSVAVPYVQTVFIRPPTPAAVSPADGEVDLFFTTSAGSVEHQVWVPGQGWSAAQALPGVTAVDGPAAVVLPGTGLQVLVRGRDNALWSDILTSVGPSGWVRLGGQLTSSPSAVVDQSGAVRVFARATNATVQTAVLSGTTPAWSGIGGVVVGAPTAGMLAPGQVSVYATGSDGKIRERTLSSSGWSAGWTVVQSGTDTTPALVLMPSTGVADLLVRGRNAALWVSERPPWSTLWSSWAHLGETLADGVTALVPSTDTLAVYAVAGTGALWGRDRVGSTWSSWYTVPTGTTWPVR